MGYLTKDMINSADDREVVEMEIPEWGGTARLMVLSGAELDRFEMLYTDPEKLKETSVRAYLVAACLVDEDGKRIFSAAEVHQLARRNGAVLARVFTKCIELNKVGDVEDKAAEVENFDSEDDDSSTTD